MALNLLASYPKSGNTWFRALLTNYFSESDQPTPFSAFLGTALLSRQAACADYLGVDPFTLTMDEQDAYRAVLCTLIAQEHPDGTFVKVHDRYAEAPELFPSNAVYKTIYLVRDPRDVALAYAYHLSCSVDETIRMMNDPDAAVFSTQDRPTGQFRQKLGTWSDHIQSWMDQTALSLHVVRYEDLCDTPVDVFSKALAFCGYQPDPDRVAFAVKASDLRTLRLLEAETGFPERNPQAESFFSRRAEPDHIDLTQEQADTVVRDHGQMMQRLGYL